MLCLLTKNNERSHLLTNNGKSVKKTIAKHLLSYYAITKTLKNNDFFIFSSSIVGKHGHKNERTNKNKEILKMVAKSSQFYNSATKKPDISNPLIIIRLIKSVHSANIKNKDNKRAGIPSHIRVSEC